MGSNPTPSANHLYNLLKIIEYLYHVVEAPHFTPCLICFTGCLDTFKKTGTFDRIDAIRFRKGPLRPPFNCVRRYRSPWFAGVEKRGERTRPAAICLKN